MIARLALFRNMPEGVVSWAKSTVVEVDCGGDLSCLLARRMEGRAWCGGCIEEARLLEHVMG